MGCGPGVGFQLCPLPSRGGWVTPGASDKRTPPPTRAGFFNTSRPATISSVQCITRVAAVAGSTRLAIRPSSASHGAGRCTTMRASSSTAPNSTAAVVATVESDRPPTSAWRGKDGAAIATAMSANISRPSKTRSTAIDASDVVKRTGSWRVATYARATSPAGAGNRLFAMKPIAVACQSGSEGNRWPSISRRIRRQRIVRSGNVAVASTTAARTNRGPAWRASSHPCRRSMRWSTQASNATLTASPRSQAPRPAPPAPQRRLLLGFDGEDNEVADFVDDRAEALAARALCGFSQFLRALAGPGSLVEQPPDIDWFSVGSAGHQFCQGRGRACLVTGSRCREHFAGLAELGGEVRRLIHRDPTRHRFPRGLRKFRDTFGDRSATSGAEHAECAGKRMRAQLALRGTRRALQRVGGLTQMLAVTDQLQAAQRRRARGRGRRSAPHDRPQRLDRDDVRLAVHEFHEQPGEPAELGALGIGAAALRDFARGVRDRRRRHLEQLGDHVAPTLRRVSGCAVQLTDRPFDAFEQIG